MKTVTEMREAAEKRAGDIADTAQKTGKMLWEGAQKTAYAVIGAPKVATKRVAEYSTKMSDTARKEFDAWVTEGEKITAHLRDGSTLEELRERMDFDQLQGRVEKLRDQLEEVLANWRETFTPEETKDVAKPAPKPAAKKPAAKKES